MAHRKKRSIWSIAGRLLTAVFVALVVWLVISRARAIDWAQVGEALRSYQAATLWLAAVLTVISYLIYAGYELLSRAVTRHRVSRQRVAAIAFVSYAFNLNLGAWIGGIGFRYRLYSRMGLKPGLITRILGTSMTTNWLGYLFLAGLAFTLRALPLPAHWSLGTGALQGIGALLLATAVAYVGLCVLSPRRSLRFRGHEVSLPHARHAVAQLVLSMLSWLMIALILWVLLRGGGIGYTTVLAVLLVAAIAGVVTHIPAGLGVTEAVFLTFLGGTVPEGQLLAALFAYRAIYYLAPLMLAIATYVGLEARARRGRLAERGPAHPA